MKKFHAIKHRMHSKRLGVVLAFVATLVIIPIVTVSAFPKEQVIDETPLAFAAENDFDSTIFADKLMVPTEGKLVAGYGVRQLVKPTMHYGVDIANVAGTPVVSSADGEIIMVGYQQQLGNYIRIQHDVNGYPFQTLSAHLGSIDVQVGDKVKQGQTIGVMGNTGGVTGSHLHFEVIMSPYRYPTDVINPLTVIPILQ